MSALSSASPTTFVATQEHVVEVTGADRLSYLDAVTTQEVASAQEGSARAALVLDANGLPLAMFEVVVLAQRVLLIVPDADVEATVMDRLAGRTFLSDARFAVRTDRVLQVVGPAARDAFGVLLGDASVGDVVEVEGMVIAADASGAVRIIGEADAIETAATALRAAGIVEGGEGDLEAWRIRSGRPAWGREVRAPHLPEELGLLPTHVHLAKGCYPGQEAVARMWMLGRPRRRLALLELDGAIGTGWTAGSGRDQVHVTSVAPDGDLALGFVPGGTQPGQRIDADDGTRVTVLALPGDDASPPGHDPAMRRRRDRAPGEQGPPRR